MISKKLVFHIYAYDSDDYFENVAYKMHMLCLKQYSYVFNKACFNISVDNTNNVEQIKRIKKDIIDCGFGDLEIIVTKNDYYCEVNTFKYFVLDKLGSSNDLIFFGHTKGIMNVIDGINYPENILHWIFTMYYFNLEDIYIEYMQKRLIHSYGGFKKTFYGGLRTFFDEINASFYPGTFYWINQMKLYEDNLNGCVRIPNIYNRNFCEDLPTIYANKNDKFNGLSSFNEIGIDEWLYDDNDWESLSNKISCGDNVKYLQLYNELRNKING
jgi:hypothetical protein